MTQGCKSCFPWEVTWLGEFDPMQQEFVILATFCTSGKCFCTTLWGMFFEDTFWILRPEAVMVRGETNKPFWSTICSSSQTFMGKRSHESERGENRKPADLPTPQENVPHRMRVNIVLWMKVVISVAADTCWTSAVTCLYHSQIMFESWGLKI